MVPSEAARNGPKRHFASESALAPVISGISAHGIPRKNTPQKHNDTFKNATASETVSKNLLYKASNAGILRATPSAERRLRRGFGVRYHVVPESASPCHSFSRKAIETPRVRRNFPPAFSKLRATPSAERRLRPGAGSGAPRTKSPLRATPSAERRLRRRFRPCSGRIGTARCYVPLLQPKGD